MICKHCTKECKSLNSLRNHERLCPKNVERNYVSHTKGIQPWNKGLTKESDDRVAKNAAAVSVAMKRKPSRMIWTEERRKAKSDWRKQLHIDHPETHPNRRLSGNRKKMSYPEQVAYNYLTRYNITFEHNKKIDKYYPDFVIGNIVIEIDGAHWHDKEKDKIRDAILTAQGYKVFRIDSKENIEERIKEILSV
jgi:very-short-patch-repair endonuclease